MKERRAADGSLLLIVGALTAIGAVMVFSASSVFAYNQFHDAAYFLKRELIWVLAGTAALCAGSFIDYAKLKAPAPWLFALSLALLGAVLLPHFGVMEGGARRWLALGPVSFQPSELAKLALIVFIAKLLADHADGARSFRRVGFQAIFWVSVCFFAVLREPDLGTASLFVMTAFIMLFVGGARLAQLLGYAAVALPALVGFVFTSPYRRARFTAFMHPWRDPQGTGYHIIQSLYALGSGGLFGVGLGQSRQKFGYLPEQYTDFIYAIIGEELGFIGAAAVLLLFLLLGYRGVRIAMRVEDRFGFFLAIGITASLVMQALMNIGVVTSTWPVTGVPLPFVSYGGTSLVVSMFSVGLLASISRGRSRAAAAAEAKDRSVSDAHHVGRRRNRGSFVPRAVTSQSALRRAR
jgi:cell division protein FtsW